jgi:hypothetical protein
VIDDVPTIPDDPRIEAIELPPSPAPAGAVGFGEVYAEIPANADPVEWLVSLRGTGLRGKIRCGGAVVPPVERLAAFVRGCRELGVAFKATAGLHHALRRNGEHGFVNLLAAALFGDAEAALADEDAAAFALDDNALRWRERTAGAHEIARVRSELFVGFGSCSVQEPVDELRALGLLPG